MSAYSQQNAYAPDFGKYPTSSLNSTSTGKPTFMQHTYQQPIRNSRIKEEQQSHSIPQNRTFFDAIDQTHMYRMFHQIRSLINHLLDDIANVYKNYGIRYPINQYHSALVRMLMPVQLNAVFDRHQIQGLFQRKCFDNIDRSYHIKSHAMRNPHTNNQNQQYYAGKQDRQVNQNSFSFQKQQQRKQQKSHRPSKYVKKNTARSRGLQSSIIMWVLGQHQKNKIITRDLIMKKARQLGKDHQFKACPRWCDNFLNRNIQIKNIVYMRQNLDYSQAKQSLAILRNNMQRQDIDGAQKTTNKQQNINNSHSYVNGGGGTNIKNSYMKSEYNLYNQKEQVKRQVKPTLYNQEDQFNSYENQGNQDNQSEFGVGSSEQQNHVKNQSNQAQDQNSYYGEENVSNNHSK